MLLSAALVLVLFLGIMGLVLDNAYRLSAEQSLSERLLLHIYALITASEEDEEQAVIALFLPEAVQEPLFNQLESGLYGFVFDEQGDEVWRSRSAVSIFPDGQAVDRMLQTGLAGVEDFYQLDEPDVAEPFFGLSYRILWQSSTGEAAFTYVVLQDLKPFRNEVAAFRNNLWGWLIAGLLLLVTVQAVIMYWGLLPIGRLESDLKAIEVGNQAFLEGEYPEEIEGVTRHLNLLLHSERAQRERYRNTLADLAHSLKTPLAIISGEIAKPDSAGGSVRQTLDEQVSRMNDIVSYQLERAKVSVRGLLKESVEIAPVVEKLTAALAKVYPEKQPVFEVSLGSEKFPGDERDLMELLGNLLDNACKYGRKRIRISASLDGDQLLMCIEDDGQGISAGAREIVLQRGSRLDTQAPGQGIGLAVVAEIVDRYQGTVTVGESDLGGASFNIRI
jgi:two-component system sensor histidine kinase PhoQ